MTFVGLFRINPSLSFHAESEIVSNIVPHVAKATGSSGHVILKMILKLLV